MSDFRYKVVFNGETVTETNNEKHALLAYGLSLEKLMTMILPSGNRKFTVELLDHGQGEFVSTSHESGKIADRMKVV